MTAASRVQSAVFCRHGCSLHQGGCVAHRGSAGVRQGLAPQVGGLQEPLHRRHAEPIYSLLQPEPENVLMTTNTEPENVLMTTNSRT